MTRWWASCVAVLAVAACGGGRAANRAGSPVPVSAAGASAATIDSLWRHAESAVRHGKWGEAEKLLNRAVLEFPPGDPRVARAHFYLGEALFAQGRQLEAAREYRKASDETP